MKNKTEFISLLKSIDTSNEDWYYEVLDPVLERLPDLYARGYLEAKIGDWGNERDQYFLEELIEWAGWDIWNKQ